jgi:hypothetical protein
MLYNPPYGSTDPDASYVDRNTPDAVSGSRVPAAAVEDTQREIIKVITEAGLAPSGADLTQLLQAIGIMIEAVRVRLPIYPEILTSDGKMTLTAPAVGVVRVPSDVGFLIRGGGYHVTEQTDFVTVINTTYHLRYDEAHGFRLRSLSSGGYNPDTLDETDPSFDSTFDDMLVARVVTNGANVATFTSLINKARIEASRNIRRQLLSALDWVALTGSPQVLNWSRTPPIAVCAVQEMRSNNAGPDGSVTSGAAGTARCWGVRIPDGELDPDIKLTRYGYPNLDYYYEDDTLNGGTISVNLQFSAS